MKNKTFGLMKDENGGKIITKFTAVTPKTFAVKIQNNKYENKNNKFKMANIKKSAS